MKYQRLASNTTPSSLQNWLEDELERRGIDGVYTRYILSLLQQDSMDLEPSECQYTNFKSHQQKVCHKYGGPETLNCGLKSKHQKWKTWGKQVLLFSNSSCCSVTLSLDLEKTRKNAAIECLKSVTDEIYDIENLIDEVCIKLKNVKNAEVENDENSGRGVKAIKRKAFNIPPSSPIDEAETYFSAFPPLNVKPEKNTELSHRNNSKNPMENVWCKNCLKKKIKTGERNESDNFFVEEANCDTPFLNESNIFQALIPYGSLKVIGNVRKNAESSEVAKNRKNNFPMSNVQKKSQSGIPCFPPDSLLQSRTEFSVSLTKNINELSSHSTVTPDDIYITADNENVSMMFVCPNMSFNNINSIQIDDSAFNIANQKTVFDFIMKHYFWCKKMKINWGAAFPYISENLIANNSEDLTTLFSSKFKNLTSLRHKGKNKLQQMHKFSTQNYDASSNFSVWSYEKETAKPCPIIEEANYFGIPNVAYHSVALNSEMKRKPDYFSSAFEKKSCTGAKLNKNVRSIQNQFTFLVKSLNSKEINYSVFDKSETIQRTIRLPFLAVDYDKKVNHHFKLQEDNVAKYVSGDIFCTKYQDSNNTLLSKPIEGSSIAEKLDMAVEFPSLLNTSYVHCEFSNTSDMYKFSFRHHEGESKFIEVAPSGIWNSPLKINFEDDEIFNSDDGSSELYFSDEEEDNLLTSSKTHFQPIKHDSFQSSHADIRITADKNDKFICKFEIVHSADRERIRNYHPKPISICKKHTGQQLLAKILHIDKVIASIDTKVKGRSISSSFDELSSFMQHNQDHWDINSFLEEKHSSFPLEAAETFEDKGTNTEDFNVSHSIKLEDHSMFSSHACTASMDEDKNVHVLKDNWFKNCHRGTPAKELLSDWKGSYNVDENIWGHDSSDWLFSGESQKLERALPCDNSEDIKALRQEIKEEEDELLRGLCCLNDESDHMFTQSNIESDHVFTRSSFESKLSVTTADTDKYTSNLKMIALNDIKQYENSMPRKLDSEIFSKKDECNEQSHITNPLLFSCEGAFLPKSMNSGYGPNRSSEAHQRPTNFFNLTTIEDSYENVNSNLQEFYQEDCVDWNSTLENLTDMDFRSYYDRSYSLGDLDQEESEHSNCNFMSSEKSLYTSDLEEELFRRNIFGRLIPRRRAKHKYPPYRRPCTFFLEGNCRRSDCRFAHDLSTITCRFWQEGSCFKGMTCPFLHGYIRDHAHHLRSHSPDCNYALESEADFPSLSAVNTEESSARSHPVDILQDKGNRTKRRKGKSQSNFNPLKSDEHETSSSWPRYKSM